MKTPKIPIQEISERLKEVGGYKYSFELGDQIKIEAKLDIKNNRQHAFISRQDGSAKTEVFWEQGKGYGRRLPASGWRRIEGNPFPDYLDSILKILKNVRNPSTEQRGCLLNVDWQVEDSPLQKNPDDFFERIIGQTDSAEGRRILRRLTERALDFSQKMSVTFDLERNWMRNASSTVYLHDKVFDAFIAFELGPIDIPGLPEAALSAPERGAPLGLFLLNIPPWGWSAHLNHGPWAQAAIDLIETTDKVGKYDTVYNGIWSNDKYDDAAARSGKGLIKNKHHPIVFGAVYEDSGDLPSTPYHDWFISDKAYGLNKKHYAAKPYLRDFHHFGGESLGLQDKWYFFFRELEDGETPATTKPGGRFYSARDWGFGGGRIDPKLNRLTFCDAIDQFNQYTFDGRRRAYLMLGHVVHLLQDQGMPDHARLVDHAGSSKAEVDIFKYYCPLLATEIAALACAGCTFFCFACSIAAFGIAEGVCMGLVNSDEVGYEKLIADNPPKIPAANVINNHDYDSFFSAIANFSDNATALKSALGCSGLTLPPLPTIPNINPDINANDPVETKPFYNLTETLLPQIIGYGAGMIQYFHEVVNPPSFVQRLAIVQWQPGDKPREFAFFSNDKEHCLRYDAKWERVGTGRSLKIVKKQKVSPGRPIYFFVQFGPAEVEPDTGRRMSQASLHLKRMGLNDEVSLTKDYDPTVGYYYWGSYNPINCTNDPITLTVEIAGRDLGAHLSTRNLPGNELDSNPVKIPYIDSSKSPDFPWIDYQPGPDVNHTITVGKLEWNGFTAEPSNLTVGREGFVKISVNQLHRDCAWEQYPGPVTCPVTWKVQTTLQDVELVRGGLRIKPDRQICAPGKYQISITCSLGVYHQTRIVMVTLL
jgi:hypothetical protein